MNSGLQVLATEVLAKGEASKAGPVGLGVILLLCIACYFLFKSMSKHMRNVRDNFPVDGVPQPPRRGHRAEAASDSVEPPASDTQ